MDDITTSTVVSEGAPAPAGAESTAPAAPPVSQEGDLAPPQTAGSVNAGDGVQGNALEQEGAAPPPSEDDPLAGIPSIDELQQQAEQRVPYAEGLLRLRTALEARNSELGEVKGKYDPLNPLLERYGDASVVQQRLETLDSLFSPVTNPQTGQPEYENGLPKYTTAPFIERADAENPGLAEQMLYDLLNYAPKDPQGQPTSPMWQQLFQQWGLDPQRLQDYRNIDALTTPPSGEITPDELQEVPEEFREVYKSLPPGVRSDLQAQDDETRRFNLEAHKERFDRRTAETQAKEQEARQQQERVAEIQTWVSGEQDKYLAEQRQEGFAAIMGDLAKQVTFSGDEATNAVMHGVVGAFITSLIDPDLRFSTEQALNALGVKLDPSFDEALNAATQHGRQYKAYELANQRLLADKAKADMRGPKLLAQTKLSQVAVAVAKAIGGTARARADAQGQSLSAATSTRPTPTDGEQADTGNGFGIPGMLATDPRYGLELARRAGLLGR